jgi:IS30 family transposase
VPLAVLVERSSRFVMIRHFRDKKGAEEVAACFAENFSGLPPELKLSMTYDRGKEMAKESARNNFQFFAKFLMKQF